MHILAAIAEFERARIAERVKAGLKRAKSQGQTLGRPRLSLSQEAIEQVRGLSVRAAARKLCISPSAARRLLSKTLLTAALIRPETLVFLDRSVCDLVSF